jgi:hypothetical protein
MALQGAEGLEIPVPPSAYEGIRAWLDRVTDRDGRVGTDRAGGDPAGPPGKDERFASHDTTAAFAIFFRIFKDRTRKNPQTARDADRLTADLPAWEGSRIDFCYWYVGTESLFWFDGTHGPRWTPWSGNVRDALESHQRLPEAGCRAGSWDPADRWGVVGGRVYATAINSMTLFCCHYHYAPLFLDEDRKDRRNE